MILRSNDVYIRWPKPVNTVGPVQQEIQKNKRASNVTIKGNALRPDMFKNWVVFLKEPKRAASTNRGNK